MQSRQAGGQRVLAMEPLDQARAVSALSPADACETQSPFHTPNRRDRRTTHDEATWQRYMRTAQHSTHKTRDTVTSIHSVVWRE